MGLGTAMSAVLFARDGPTNGREKTMGFRGSFNFKKARRIIPREVETFRKGIEKKLGVKRPRRVGRPLKEDKYKPISIRLHPRILSWAKAQGKKRGVGYQTIINEILLRKAA
jgi:uncharacterized protein (DUF4415 family)